MKIQFIGILFGLSLLMLLCIVGAFKDKRKLAVDVRGLLLAAVIPMAGNILVAVSKQIWLCNIGYLMYFFGVDIVFYFLVRYSMSYCSYEFDGTALKKILITVTALDVVSILLNNFTGHVFEIAKVRLLDYDTYYMQIPHIGEYIHFTLNYIFFAIVIATFVRKIRSISRAYRERFYVIIGSLVIICIWETFCILSKDPIDGSMIGYGVCGLLVYFFSLRYVPFFVKGILLSRITNDMDEALFFFDTDDECIYVNQSATEMFGVDLEDKEKNFKFLRDLAGGDDADFSKNFEVKKCRETEEGKRYLSIRYFINYDSNKKAVGSFYAIRDYTDEELENQSKMFLATHDALTGLLNKQAFYDKVEERLKKDLNNDYVLVVSDIKDFKIINDVYGTEAGDTVLKKVADILKNSAGEDDIYCRLQNDRFAVLKKKQDFENIYKGQREKNITISIDNYIDYKIVSHFGAYYITDRNMLISVMVDRAFMAVAGIKHEYNSSLAIYDEAIRDNRIWEKSISNALGDAIRERQLIPYLQPQVNDKGEMEGAEALVRWNHPTEGFLTPNRFIPIFEKNGMIAEVDKYMWEEACKLLSKWKGEKSGLSISVNISPKDFYFMDVYKVITGLVEKYEISPSALHLEITESFAITDFDKKMVVINKFRDKGFIVEMDDFGSGYSSLNLLQDMPIDVLKIDMMFLRRSEEEEKAHIILKTITEMAKNLGIPSIAEGVETEEQLEMLRKMGCTLYQGYYFSKPVPIEEFENKMKLKLNKASTGEDENDADTDDRLQNSPDNTKNSKAE